MNKFSGVLSLALCGLFWSTAGIFIKNVNASSFTIAGLRSLIALLTFMMALRKLPVLRIKNTDGTTDRASTFYLWLGGICYSATMILFCAANKMTTSANAVLLQYSYPIYVIMFGPMILGEKNRKSDFITVIGVLVGVVLFFYSDIDAGKLLGNVLAALSGVAFAFTTIFMRKQKSEGSAASFMVSHLVTAAVCIPFYFTNGIAVSDYTSIICIFALGIFQMAFANILFAKGIGSVTALSASIITMIEPLMNPVWVMLFAGEVPGFLCIIGGIMILGCIIFREVVSSRKVNAA
ncbi:MAG: EamA family transporter [Treponema sp.]|nr:EamA family transporter [Candidatus Treponema equi]